MRLIQAWRVMAAALPLEGVYLSQGAAQAVADDLGGMARFIRPFSQWAIQDGDTVILLPESCLAVDTAAEPIPGSQDAGDEAPEPEQVMVAQTLEDAEDAQEGEA